VGPSPAALLYSCTLTADVTTDPSGRIVDVTLLKIESSIQGIGVALRAVGPGRNRRHTRHTRPAGPASVQTVAK
jgi:hypothetical protein